MKTKIRCRFALAIVAILYASFKILKLHVNLHSVDMKPDVFRPAKTGMPLNMTGVRDSQMLKAFSVDWNIILKDNPWDIAARWVTERNVIPENPVELGGVLRELSRRRIIRADVAAGIKGNNLKLLLVLDGGQQVVLKPKRCERDTIVTGAPNAGTDRHNGEIAAFHLSRLLGFRCTPLAVGRIVDLESELIPVATKELLATFYKRDGNICFYGKCRNCFGERTGVCAEGKRIEGSISMWLPEKLRRFIHPWWRTYGAGVTAIWENDVDYCSVVKGQFPEGPRVLDLVDTAIFDYLIRNADRHIYEAFAKSKNSSIVMLDNGRSFGHPFHDEETILAPLFQCCTVRYRTYNRLRELNSGSLSRLLRHLTAYDPIAPVISDPHFAALDRRLGHVIEMIQDCIVKWKDRHPVLIDDTFR